MKMEKETVNLLSANGDLDLFNRSDKKRHFDSFEDFDGIRAEELALSSREVNVRKKQLKTQQKYERKKQQQQLRSQRKEQNAVLRQRKETSNRGVRHQRLHSHKSFGGYLKAFLKGLFLTLLVAVDVLAFIILYPYVPLIREYYQFAVNLMEDAGGSTFRSSETSYVYDAEGNQLARLKGDEERIYVPYKEIPLAVRNSFLAIEDRRFFEHSGIDFWGLVRVAYRFVLTKGEEMHGASTVTQQLARTVFLSSDVSLERKVKEAFLAIMLEQKFSKEEILEFYLNNIYFGNGYYGVAAAANGYFNKSLGSLSIEEVAFLTAIPNNPSWYNPLRYKEHTLLRMEKVLRDMKECGYITNASYKAAKDAEITLDTSNSIVHNYEVTYAIDCAIRVLMERDGFDFRYSFHNTKDRKRYEKKYTQEYEAARERLYQKGYRIYTSIDSSQQRILQKSVDTALAKRTKKVHGVYALQGSAVCIDNVTGKVTAIVGGRTQEDLEGAYTLNRAYQSFRQPGSAIKPVLVYAPSVDVLHYGAKTKVRDDYFKYGPKNSDGVYEDEITLRQSLAKSSNTAAWRIYENLTPQVGIPYLLRMQFAKIVANDYFQAAALGGFTYGVTNVELTASYACLAHDGIYREPTCLVSFLSVDGEELLPESEAVQVYSAKAAQSTLGMMQSVFGKKGSASSAKWNLPVEIAGKTGTTNGSVDGWFVGMSPYYTVGVWCGRDMPKSVSGLSGSTFPLDVWNLAMYNLCKRKPAAEFDLSKVAGGSKIVAVVPEQKHEPDINQLRAEEAAKEREEQERLAREEEERLAKEEEKKRLQEEGLIDVTEPRYQWIASYSDDHELSSGYTVANYKSDHFLCDSIDAIIDSDGSFEDAKELWLQIYGNTLKNQYRSVIESWSGRSIYENSGSQSEPETVSEPDPVEEPEYDTPVALEEYSQGEPEVINELEEEEPTIVYGMTQVD